MLSSSVNCPSEAARAYDLQLAHQNSVGSSSNAGILDWDNIQDKQERIQKRWDAVLDRKSTVIESKQAHLHELLMKKFNKERKVKERMDEKHADQAWTSEKRAEKQLIAKQRKEDLDNREMK